jgi:hypothetical protein
MRALPRSDRITALEAAGIRIMDKLHQTYSRRTASKARHDERTADLATFRKLKFATETTLSPCVQPAGTDSPLLRRPKQRPSRVFDCYCDLWLDIFVRRSAEQRRLQPQCLVRPAVGDDRQRLRRFRRLHELPRRKPYGSINSRGFADGVSKKIGLSLPLRETMTDFSKETSR